MGSGSARALSSSQDRPLSHSEQLIARGKDLATRTSQLGIQPQQGSFAGILVVAIEKIENVLDHLFSRKMVHIGATIGDSMVCTLTHFHTSSPY